MFKSSKSRAGISIFIYLCLVQIILGQTSCELSLPDFISTASNSFAYGPGTIGGVTDSASTIIVQVVDYYERNVTNGRDDVRAVVLDPASNPVTVLSANNQDGTFSFTFEPTAAGVYTITATVNGQEIYESPLNPIFLQSSVCPLKYDTTSGPYLREAFSSKV